MLYHIFLSTPALQIFFDFFLWVCGQIGKLKECSSYSIARCSNTLIYICCSLISLFNHVPTYLYSLFIPLLSFPSIFYIYHKISLVFTPIHLHYLSFVYIIFIVLLIILNVLFASLVYFRGCCEHMKRKKEIRWTMASCASFSRCWRNGFFMRGYSKIHDLDNCTLDLNIKHIHNYALSIPCINVFRPTSTYTINDMNMKRTLRGRIKLNLNWIKLNLKIPCE